jgi:hypothetical protein
MQLHNIITNFIRVSVRVLVAALLVIPLLSSTSFYALARDLLDTALLEIGALESSEALYNNRFYCQSWYNETGTNLDMVTIYYAGQSSYTNLHSVRLRPDSNNYPGADIAVSSKTNGIVAYTPQQYTFDQAITPDTTYWLCVYLQNGNTSWYRSNSDVYADGRAVSNAGGWTNFSADMRLDIAVTVPDPPLADPVLLAPVGTISSSSPVFTWLADETATSYELAIEDDETTTLYDQYHLPSLWCADGYCQVDIVQLLAGDYSWSVTVSDGDDTASSSATFSQLYQPSGGGGDVTVDIDQAEYTELTLSDESVYRIEQSVSFGEAAVVAAMMAAVGALIVLIMVSVVSTRNRSYS